MKANSFSASSFRPRSAFRFARSNARALSLRNRFHFEKLKCVIGVSPSRSTPWPGIDRTGRAWKPPEPPYIRLPFPDVLGDLLHRGCHPRFLFHLPAGQPSELPSPVYSFIRSPRLDDRRSVSSTFALLMSSSAVLPISRLASIDPEGCGIGTPVLLGFLGGYGSVSVPGSLRFRFPPRAAVLRFPAPFPLPIIFSNIPNRSRPVRRLPSRGHPYYIKRN